MKELDSHAGIVINNTLLGKILQSTKDIYINNGPAWLKVCVLDEYYKIEYREKTWFRLNVKLDRANITNVTKKMVVDCYRQSLHIYPILLMRHRNIKGQQNFAWQIFLKQKYPLY